MIVLLAFLFFFFWRDIGEVNWGLSEILWERVRCENLVDCFSFTLGKPAIQSSTSFLAFLPAPELELKWSHNRTPQLSWKYPTVSFKQSHYLTNASHDLFFFFCVLPLKEHASAASIQKPSKKPRFADSLAPTGG